MNIPKPVGFPQVVCLCGSMRFMDVFRRTGWELTLLGHIVLTVGVCKHALDPGEFFDKRRAKQLDELHMRKIDLADWVMILNVDNYIGESTRAEIVYARRTGKMVVFLVPTRGEDE